MTRKQCYLFSLLLPLAAPILIIVTAKLSGHFLRSSHLLGWFSLISLFYCLCCGLQYGLFILFAQRWARNKTDKQIALANLAMPIWFWAWCSACLLIAALYTGHVKLYLMLGLFIIPYHYIFVIPASLLIPQLVKTQPQVRRDKNA